MLFDAIYNLRNADIAGIERAYEGVDGRGTPGKREREGTKGGGDRLIGHCTLQPRVLELKDVILYSLALLISFSVVNYAVLIAELSAVVPDQQDREYEITIREREEWSRLGASLSVAGLFRSSAAKV